MRAVLRDERIHERRRTRASNVDAAARLDRRIANDRAVHKIRRTRRDVDACPRRRRALRDRDIIERIDVRVRASEANDARLVAAAERNALRPALDTDALLDKEFLGQRNRLTRDGSGERYRIACVGVRDRFPQRNEPVFRVHDVLCRRYDRRRRLGYALQFVSAQIDSATDDASITREIRRQRYIRVIARVDRRRTLSERVTAERKERLTRFVREVRATAARPAGERRQRIVRLNATTRRLLIDVALN